MLAKRKKNDAMAKDGEAIYKDLEELTQKDEV